MLGGRFLSTLPCLQRINAIRHAMGYVLGTDYFSL
jgi:hypothetical protein